MRDYFSTLNLIRATALGAVVTAMAAPRIAQAGGNMLLMMSSCLFCMSLVAGAVTAWGHEAGLPGPFLPARETMHGLGMALLAAVVMSPLQHWVIQPALLNAVRSSADSQWTQLQIPDSFVRWLALALWSAGFQPLFCIAAPTCLAAWLTGRVWPAYVLTAALGAFVASRQLDAYHIETGRMVLISASAAKGLLGTALYVRYGLLPCSLLAIGYSLHLLLNT